MDRKMLMTEIPAVGDTSSGAGQGTGNRGRGYHWDTLPTLYWLPENWLKACSALVRELHHYLSSYDPEQLIWVYKGEIQRS